VDINSKLMQEITIGVSVIICCYNSALKLESTLTHLALQDSAPNIPFEIILVNNNSTDNTVEIAKKKWKSIQEPFPLFVIDECKPGLNNARLKGIEKAKYEYIILCDDDNSLCSKYISTVTSIFEKKNDVVMIGGVGEAVLQIVAPSWFSEVKGFGYAVGNEARVTGYTDSVYGAGMAIRKSVFKYLQNENVKFILTDRIGKTLSSGGDTELCTLINCSKGKIWFDESLTFKHCLEEHRINWLYYLKLRASFGIANAYLNLYLDEYTQTNSITVFINFAKFVIRYPHLIFLAKWKYKAKYADAIQRYNFLKTIYVQRKNLRDKLLIAKANMTFMKMNE
jgi:glycosyltransferase involved in cell wall biosynthesis